jgi:uncharacterized protein (TIGR00725 family)
MKNLRKPVIGVMGPGESADTDLLLHAEELGKRIAENGWILLTGGREAGIMDAASKGAYEAGGTVIGILPGDNHTGISNYVSIPVLTGMGHARNMINILTSDVVVICGMGYGTASEAALALKQDKPLIFTKVAQPDTHFFSRQSGAPVDYSDDVEKVIAWIKKQIK